MSVALATSLDYQKTLKAVTKLAVANIADWCAVDILRDDGRIERLALAHVDPAKIELAKTVRERYENPTAPHSVPYVIQTGTPAMVPEITDAMIVAAAQGDEERVRLVRALGAVSYLCVPMIAGGRTVGALTLASAESGRRYTDDDLRFAEDVASRTAMAVENARVPASPARGPAERRVPGHALSRAADSLERDSWLFAHGARRSLDCRQSRGRLGDDRTQRDEPVADGRRRARRLAHRLGQRCD